MLFLGKGDEIHSVASYLIKFHAIVFNSTLSFVRLC